MAEKRSKTDFDKTWQYQRILEILDCYWLSQPDEEYVEVKMYFRHKSGEEQTKHIVWSSEPDYFCSRADYCLQKALEYSSVLNNCCAFVKECVYSGECHFGSEYVDDCEEREVFQTIKEALERKEE